ncbi:heavy metal translocating P-type ATPase [Segniliparus rotundus DSM 44985]|uniref:Heavy metal translocating P-type ATPase n=1 Tax=Segniliparus rotundus (strain ATCC BAA-972 / CDC 1076 / CIP 108378 / DSM 44985 / JCM 13578) TaxID=640132 RepID=D6Z9K9_SEGRD|nr:hypothetical protein [Segniliparus rotundus]ADG96536.1 heavy metal translocating P-type ATPase [Segniliparus rotundus DSM 44985]
MSEDMWRDAAQVAARNNAGSGGRVPLLAFVDRSDMAQVGVLIAALVAMAWMSADGLAWDMAGVLSFAGGFLTATLVNALVFTLMVVNGRAVLRRLAVEKGAGE